MATRKSLEEMVESRLRCAKYLLENKEWHLGSYIMGYVLECALKATVCKVLKVKEYPADMKFKDDKIPNFFRTHFFDRLSLLAGMYETFSPLGIQEEFDNWSQFTTVLAGDWHSMRYADSDKQIDELTANSLYEYLTADAGIINTIKKTWK